LLPLDDINLEFETKAQLILKQRSCSCPQILIVDDNDFNSFTLKELINMSFKLESDTSLNGKEALERVRERKCCQYKLIFMDCMMPIMDGFEATREIRKYQRT
jgi:CheY-like chemotaxis protein